MSYPPPEPFDPTRPADPTMPGPPPASPPPAPTAFQPGVASPMYQQPTYPQDQPGYPQTAAYPGYAPPPGRPGGRGGSAALLWGLIALFAVLLCAGAGVAGVIAYNNSSDDPIAAPTPAGNPATGQPAPDPTDDPGLPPSEAPAPPATGAPGAGVVTYEVTGDGPASIQYAKDGQGGFERIEDVRLPWRVEIPKDKGQFVVNVMASRDSGDKGKITCRIRVNGKEVAKQTSSGPYAIAICLDVSFD